MRILHLYSYQWYTGPAEPMLRLARAQRQAGHRVEIARDRHRRGDLDRWLEQFGLGERSDLWLSVKAGPAKQLRDWLRLRRDLAADRYDVVHCHRSHDHVLAALARGRRTRGPMLVRTLHRPVSNTPGRSWLLRRTDGVLTPCRRHRDLLLERGWLSPERVLAIEGVVDPQELARPAGDLRGELGLADTAPVAGTVARMKPGRGLRLLLQAWRVVAGKLPEARLVLAGRGELERRLRRQVEGDSLLRRSVLFAGYRQDLGRTYRTFDLMVLLAPGNDGTCRAALQAMACGRPVLAAARDALAEIVEPGQSGQLVPPADGKALATALGDLLSQPRQLRRMGREAARQAARRFTIDRQARMVEEFYTRLLEGQRRAG